MRRRLGPNRGHYSRRWTFDTLRIWRKVWIDQMNDLRLLNDLDCYKFVTRWVLKMFESIGWRKRSFYRPSNNEWLDVNLPLYTRVKTTIIRVEVLSLSKKTNILSDTIRLNMIVIIFGIVLNQFSRDSVLYFPLQIRRCLSSKYKSLSITKKELALSFCEKGMKNI